ncbi:MAG: hypothetical protein LBL13_11150 [Bacteroidales bacterium]|jgi:hypothetical protein|nr:hypothetical protein [Bacteroidales bacterium]
MKLFNNCLFIAIIIAMGVLSQACWKDKTLKDKGFDDMHINISPSYGIPLANVDIQGKDLVTQINKDSAKKNYFIEYDASDYDLCVITYDKTNIPVTLPTTLNSFDTIVSYPLSFFSDLRRDGWRPKEAFFFLYVDNSYNVDFRLNIRQLDYDNMNGHRQPIVREDLRNVNLVQASTNSSFKRSLVINEFTLTNPSDIIFRGTQVDFDFGFSTLESHLYPNYGGSLNLNPIIKVPAYFTLNNFIRRDTTSVNLTEVADIFNDTSALSLQNITFYLSITNGLPLVAKLQVYFADANYRIIDSLQMSEIELKSGIPDASFLVKTPGITTAEISMSKDRFKRIKDSKYLIFKEYLSSYNSDDVKLFKSSFMKILLSCKLDTQLDGKISDISY